MHSFMATLKMNYTWNSLRGLLIQHILILFAVYISHCMDSSKFLELGFKGSIHFLVHDGFFPSKADSSLFIKHHGDNHLFVLVYVDDILVTGSSSTLIDGFVKQLHDSFPVRDMGHLHYFLSVEVVSLKDGLLLSQHKYIQYFLSHTKMLESKPCYTPMVVSPPLSKSSSNVFHDGELYRQIVGALQYITLTHHVHCPTVEHWKAVK